MKTTTLLLTILLGLASNAMAATYYIDFDSGNNEADGTTPATAWKHSPGDNNATGQPKGVKLQPGDILRYKGGVQYRGEIAFRNLKGAEGKPIVFDGNADGSYGEGPAILDGSKRITGWNKVDSAEQVGGNPKWREIMYADVDMDLTSNFTQDQFILHRDTSPVRQAPWQRLFLIDGEKRVLPIAQMPKPSDAFYPDLPGDFYKSPIRLADNYPHKVYYPEGSRGNRSVPIIGITYGGTPPVVEPLDRGEVALDLAQPETIAEIGLKLYRPESHGAPESLAFYADGEQVLEAKVDPENTELQRFKLDKPVKASTITFQLRAPNTDRRWTKIQQIAAYTPAGENVIEHEVTSIIEDPERLIKGDPNWYDDMFVGVHGGNSHVYFAKPRRFEPDTHRLFTPHFTNTTYDHTSYAFYNSPKFINLPGEWVLKPLEGGKTRVYLLPETLKDGQPADIGYPVLTTALAINEGSEHIEVRGFLMQRYAGGKGGVALNGNGNGRPTNIRIADCEVRFMSGQSGISLNHSDHITVDNCYVHHCPGWTVGIYVNRINHYSITNTRVDYNSGSGIRHYEATNGELKNNVVINHFGMHSSALNFYEGCRDILFEGNYIQYIIPINRSAERLTFRNNVVDGMGKSAVTIAMWLSGSTRGTHIKDITFEKNTFVNVDKDAGWDTAIFMQGGASTPEGVVVRDNILARLREPFPAQVQDNIFMLKTDPKLVGTGSMMVGDPNELFIDPENGDWRRKPGGPMMNAGADVPPPPAKWTR